MRPYNKEHGMDDITTVQLPMTTIDKIVEEKNLGVFEFIKIDIQGAEYYAIQGGRNTIMQAEVVVTDVSILQVNSPAPPFYKIQSLMNNLGFAFYDMNHESRTTRHLLAEFEVTWVKKSSSLWDEKCTKFPAPSFHAHNKAE